MFLWIKEEEEEDEMGKIQDWDYKL